MKTCSFCGKNAEAFSLENNEHCCDDCLCVSLSDLDNCEAAAVPIPDQWPVTDEIPEPVNVRTVIGHYPSWERQKEYDTF